jgi:DNA/RNA endonuclease G (NUC1)
MTATAGVASGMTSTDIGVLENSAPVGQSLQRSANGSSWTGPVASTMGFVNACGGTPPPANSLSFSGRDPVADPPLPVGFEAQVFATEKSGGTTVTTNFVWSSDTPAIASIDQNGVFTALSAGTAVLRATATDGTTGTYSLPTIVGVHSSVPYGGNTEFGDPTDADASDDFIIRRPEYTTSFNKNKLTPNWVSYKLDVTDYGPEDRCNCFTFDPELTAAGFTRITTADYTGAGAFAGYGIDRGHMDRSADRTAASLDNARTYYFGNIIPQAADLNQGPWAQMENDLGDMAKSQGKEVYVVSGPAGNGGTVKGEGKIVIPTWVWKVVLIMPAGKGLPDVHSPSDVQVIAVSMPNIAGIKGVDWNTYRTTIDSVEKLSGYDLFKLLPANVQAIVESGDHSPAITSFTTSAPTAVGSPMTASLAFTDPDAGDTHTAVVTWGDGTTSTVNAGTALSASPTHTYTSAGLYTVSVVLQDQFGASASATANTVTIYSATQYVTGSGQITGQTLLPLLPSFTIDVRYASGATMPSGTFEMHGSTVVKNTTATSFDYLLINGSVATFKGTGVQSDGTNIGFLVSVLSGGKPDKGRIKVWNLSTGAVIYDTNAGKPDTFVPTTAIRNGSVVIH